jgi:DNA modification methylase
MSHRIERIGDCRLILGDCREVLPTLGNVDAVVTDPPYGIDFGNFNRTNKLRNGTRYKANKYHNSDWDTGFDLSSYLPLLNEASEHQIIWGGNYFPCLWLNPVKGFIFWNKSQPCKNFSAGELAWTSIDMPAKLIDYPYYGNIEGSTSATEKEHPTQKPAEVMKLCIEMFKHSPETILDCFMGSGTTGVACAKLGRKFIGVELEERYFNIACKRIEQAYKQPDLFIEPPKKAQQEVLL